MVGAGTGNTAVCNRYTKISGTSINSINSIVHARVTSVVATVSTNSSPTRPRLVAVSITKEHGKSNVQRKVCMAISDSIDY